MKFTACPKVECQATVLLDEAELRALYALTVYGVDKVCQLFSDGLGSALKDHESGLRSLMEFANKEVPPILQRVNVARSAFAQPGHS